jgi:hypothetical protein
MGVGAMPNNTLLVTWHKDSLENLGGLRSMNPFVSNPTSISFSTTMNELQAASYFQTHW